MLDENPNAGGQIYRAITVNPVPDKALLGADYWRGKPLAEELAKSATICLYGTAVWSVTPLSDAAGQPDGFEIGLSRDGAARIVDGTRRLC